MKNLYREITHSIKNIFRIKYFLFFALGCLATYLLVVYGFDWWYFRETRNTTLNQVFFPGIVIGGLLPILLPTVLLVIGRLRVDKVYYFWSRVIITSALLGWFTSSFVKAFTGRIQPNIYNLTDNISTGFNFGFWQHGIFWGWPSSHTTVAFSMSVAAATVLLKNKRSNKNQTLIVLCILYALYIGVSVSLSIHWFSDFLMGTLLGTIVGHEVGKVYRGQKQ